MKIPQKRIQPKELLQKISEGKRPNLIEPNHVLKISPHSKKRSSELTRIHQLKLCQTKTNWIQKPSPKICPLIYMLAQKQRYQTQSGIWYCIIRLMQSLFRRIHINGYVTEFNNTVLWLNQEGSCADLRIRPKCIQH